MPKMRWSLGSCHRRGRGARPCREGRPTDGEVVSTSGGSRWAWRAFERVDSLSRGFAPPACVEAGQLRHWAIPRSKAILSSVSVTRQHIASLVDGELGGDIGPRVDELRTRDATGRLTMLELMEWGRARFA